MPFHAVHGVGLSVLFIFCHQGLCLLKTFSCKGMNKYLDDA